MAKSEDKITKPKIMTLHSAHTSTFMVLKITTDIKYLFAYPCIVVKCCNPICKMDFEMMNFWQNYDCILRHGMEIDGSGE